MHHNRFLVFSPVIIVGLTLWAGSMGSAWGQERALAQVATDENESKTAPEGPNASTQTTNENGFDNLGLVALGSIVIAGLTIALGSIAPALGEGRAVAQALSAIAQQPDASNTITRTLFVGLAMVESTAIYCFVVSMILLFANPFWAYFTQ